MFLNFTCGHNPPAAWAIPVHIASNNTTKVIQSGPVEAGHKNCSALVVSSNLSGETINESHVFSKLYSVFSFAVVGFVMFVCVLFIDTTDVQMFNAHQNSGKIYFTFKVAINSSLLQFTVNVLSSTGKNVNIPVWRTSNQRQLSNKTMVLPVGLYYLSLFAWDSSNTYVSTNIAMSVNLTWSNYSSPTLLIFTPSPTLMLTSPTPIPTTGEL